MGEKESRENNENFFKQVDSGSKISSRNLARMAQELGGDIDEEMQDTSLRPG